MNLYAKIEKICPTVFLRNNNDDLEQMIEVEIVSACAVDRLLLEWRMNGCSHEFVLEHVAEGVSKHHIFLQEVLEITSAEILLKAENILDQRTVTLKPPKHWVVHVVQRTHHDVGYTDLPSIAVKDHERWLDEAVDMAAATAESEEDAKFRIVVEQTWSIDHYLKNAPAHRAAKMIELLQKGDFELTALFGNMTTEICGHESLTRALYHAFRLKRQYGLDLVSAEHNDVPGMSWGLSRVLTDAGIKLLCAGLPLYYSMVKGFRSFWNQKEIFLHEGPGAFWWEAPSKKRVLVWSNNGCCGGVCRDNLSGLAERLQQLSESDYPYSVLRWHVQAGQRDNSPYTLGYAETVKDWNQQWVYPHLLSSTNARFYEDFIKQVPSDLPIIRGELAGQDYPVGATSTAASTAMNRNNHNSLMASEGLAVSASVVTDYPYPSDTLFDAYEDVLWYDEHTWGFHFPAGPAAVASEYEKAIHAYRAAALSHGVENKAMARIADQIRKDTDGVYCVVFNNTQNVRTAPLQVLLRALDNSGSEMAVKISGDESHGKGILKGYILGYRWHVVLQGAFLRGKFDLIDVSSGEKVPFQMIERDSPMDTVPYAAQRVGIGSGTRRYGGFELPEGLKKELCFVARNVPAFGYKTYRLIPNDEPDIVDKVSGAEMTTIENEFFKVRVNPNSGVVVSIYDKAGHRELVDDKAPHGFGTVIVREKNSEEVFSMQCSSVAKTLEGPVCTAIEMQGSIYGHPIIRQTVKLYAGIQNVYFETRVLKDAVPLLNVYIAFPFQTEAPKFRYEGALSVMEPIRDYMPGSYSDTIAVQNWVKIENRGDSILWSSVDAPIVSLGGLWKGYVSPAHRCVLDESVIHDPLQIEDLKKGWIYSQIFSNNHGTNFSVSQVADVLFRYVISTREGTVSDGEAAAFGWQSSIPLESIFTEGFRTGSLAVENSFVEVDNENVVLLTQKRAEDGEGFVFRLWNMSGREEKVNVKLNFIKVNQVIVSNMAEEMEDSPLEHDGSSFTACLAPDTIMTVRVK